MMFDDFLFSGCISLRLNHALHLEWQLVLWKRPETKLMIMIFCEDVSPEKGNGPVEYLQQKIIEWRESPLLSLQLCKVLTLIIPPPWSWSPTRLPTHTVHNMRITQWTGVAAPLYQSCVWMGGRVRASIMLGTSHREILVLQSNWGNRDGTRLSSCIYVQLYIYIHLEKKSSCLCFGRFHGHKKNKTLRGINDSSLTL